MLRNAVDRHLKSDNYFWNHDHKNTAYKSNRKLFRNKIKPESNKKNLR